VFVALVVAVGLVFRQGARGLTAKSNDHDAGNGVMDCRGHPGDRRYLAVIRKQVLWGVVLIVDALLVGPGGFSIFTRPPLTPGYCGRQALRRRLSRDG
jgi:hypothetical protein